MSMQPFGGARVPGPVLVSIGSISASADEVMTPGGAWAAADVNVNAQDQTSTTTHIPAWAIVMTIVTVWFFLIGLLFLLAKERRTQGTVTVTIWANGQTYSEYVPVWNEMQRADVFNRVSYLQNLIGAARSRRGAWGA